MPHESQRELLPILRDLRALLGTMPINTPWADRYAILEGHGVFPGQPQRISGPVRSHHKDAIAHNERWDLVPVAHEAMIIPAPNIDLSDDVEDCETLDELHDLINGTIYAVSNNGVSRADLPGVLLERGIDLEDLPVYADVVEPRSVYTVLSYDYNRLLIKGPKKRIMTKIIPLVPEANEGETRAQHIRRAHVELTGHPIEQTNAMLAYLAHCSYLSARQLHAILEHGRISDGLYLRLLAVLRKLAERAAGAITLSGYLTKTERPTLMLNVYNHEGRQEHVFTLTGCDAMEVEARAEELARLFKAARPGYTGYIASRDTHLSAAHEQEGDDD